MRSEVHPCSVFAAAAVVCSTLLPRAALGQATSAPAHPSEADPTRLATA
jgi:hypothetical protein